MEKQKKQWWTEWDWNIGVRQQFNMTLLHEEQTPFQKLYIYDHDYLGKVLVLDDVHQTNQRDECGYHDMMSHVPILGRKEALDKKPCSVLIIGGGDGGTLREVLVHDFVTKAVMVEIDQRVVELCSEYLKINGDYKDPRVTLLYEDAAKYIADPKIQANPFDVIIVDATDPTGGPGDVLYADEFYENLKKCLTPTGVVTRHLGVPGFQPQMLADGYKKAKKFFPSVEVYKAVIPAYLGGEMSFMACSKDGHSSKKPFGQVTRKYYNPEIHEGSFALPTWWKKLINE